MTFLPPKHSRLGAPHRIDILLPWFHIFLQLPSSFSLLHNKLLKKWSAHTIFISSPFVYFLSHSCFFTESTKLLSSRPLRTSLKQNFKNIFLVLILLYSAAFNTINPSLLLETLSLAWMIPGSPGFSSTSLYLYSLFFLFPPLKVVVSQLQSPGLSSLLILHTLPSRTCQFQLFQLLTDNASCSYIYVFLAQINLLSSGPKYLTSSRHFHLISLHIPAFLTHIKFIGSSSLWNQFLFMFFIWEWYLHLPFYFDLVIDFDSSIFFIPHIQSITKSYWLYFKHLPNVTSPCHWYYSFVEFYS